MTAVQPLWAGDAPPARARMIERHLPLVRGIAHRFAGRGEPLDDLVQVGNVALIAAVDRCERGRERQFTSYAAACVEGEIRRHLRDRCDPLRVPRHLQGDTVLMAPLRAPATLEGVAETAVAQPTELVEVVVALALVASAALSLEPFDRRVLAMRCFLDLSQ